MATKLTLEQKNLKVVYEVPYDDVTGGDMIQALKTVMVGMTFSEDAFDQALRNYVSNLE